MNKMFVFCCIYTFLFAQYAFYGRWVPMKAQGWHTDYLERHQRDAFHCFLFFFFISYVCIGLHAIAQFRYCSDRNKVVNGAAPQTKYEWHAQFSAASLIARSGANYITTCIIPKGSWVEGGTLPPVTQSRSKAYCVDFGRILGLYYNYSGSRFGCAPWWSTSTFESDCLVSGTRMVENCSRVKREGGVAKVAVVWLCAESGRMEFVPVMSVPDKQKTR